LKITSVINIKKILEFFEDCIGYQYQKKTQVSKYGFVNKWGGKHAQQGDLVTGGSQKLETQFWHMAVLTNEMGEENMPNMGAS
jgi:hypothetical protein